MPFRTLRSLLLLATFVVAALPAQAQQRAARAESYCYLVADNNDVRLDADVFTRVDKLSGEETEIGTTGTILIEAIAFSPESGTLYAADGDRLGMIDLTTGAFVGIAEFGYADGEEGTLRANDVDGLTYDPTSGRLIGSVRRMDANDLLVSIDPATGFVVPDAFGSGRDYVPVRVGQLPIDVDDLAVSPVSGGLFAVATQSDGQSLLLSVDRESGYAVIQAQLPGDDLEGLSFDFDGRLFASPGSDGPDLVEINLTTGELTPVASVGTQGNRDYEALECMAEGDLAGSTDRTFAAQLPRETSLLPAYPNPFNPSTTLRFELPAPSDIRLTVFDMLGREVAVPAAGFWPAGTNEIRFEAGSLPSGLYLFRLVAPGYSATRTVTLLR